MVFSIAMLNYQRVSMGYNLGHFSIRRMEISMEDSHILTYLTNITNWKDPPFFMGKFTN